MGVVHIDAGDTSGQTPPPPGDRLAPARQIARRPYESTVLHIVVLSDFARRTFVAGDKL